MQVWVWFDEEARKKLFTVLERTRKISRDMLEFLIFGKQLYLSLDVEELGAMRHARLLIQHPGEALVSHGVRPVL